MKGNTHGSLRVGLLVCFDFHLHIKAAMMSIWMHKKILVDRNIDESNVRATVVDNVQHRS